MSLTESRWVDVNVTSEETGRVYTGRFQLKPFLKMSEKTEANLLAERLSRGLPQDNAHAMVLRAVAVLKYHILSADATWWTNDGLDLLEELPIFAIADKLDEFKQSLKPKKAEDVLPPLPAT